MLSLGKLASNDLSLRKLTPVPFIIGEKKKKKLNKRSQVSTNREDNDL